MIIVARVFAGILLAVIFLVLTLSSVDQDRKAKELRETEAIVHGYCGELRKTPESDRMLACAKIAGAECVAMPAVQQDGTLADVTFAYTVFGFEQPEATCSVR